MAEVAGKNSPEIELAWRRKILQQNPADPDVVAAFCVAAARADEVGEATQALAELAGR